MIRKMSLISKFITWQPGKQTVAINILPDTSDNEIGRLIEYDIRNTQNVMEKLFPDPFLKI